MMQKNTFQLLNQEFGIHESVLKAVSEAEEQVKGIFQELDDIMAFNQYKVLDAFQKNRITDMHFGWNTGYGYDDPGREALEKVYSHIFKTEAALVRPIIVNGTHALTLTLTGI
jgi:cystathionine beta-lyase family protein involved in aluminum resistance